MHESRSLPVTFIVCTTRQAAISGFAPKRVAIDFPTPIQSLQLNAAGLPYSVIPEDQDEKTL